MSHPPKRFWRKFLAISGKILLVIVVVLAGAALYLDLHLCLLPVPHELDAAIREQIAAAKLPGAAMAVFKGNQVVFARGYGLANIAEKRAATPDTLFQIASVSKLATATAVMRLYEQGGFQLDDDVDRYLPFPVRNPQFPDTPITFRMLLAHESSITDGPAYLASYTLGKSEDPTEPLGEFLREYLAPNGRYYDARQNFIAAQPGTQYAYSNVGFGLLGYLVEHISGLPFDEYCRQQVFTPLGMTATRWFNRDVDKSRMAMPYDYDALRRRYTPLGFYGFSTYPDGLLKTSVNEFARLLSVYVNGGRAPDGTPFLRPETVAEMLRAQYPQIKSVGLAWHIGDSGDLYQHGGGDPGVFTDAVISTKGQWGFVFFSNGGPTSLRTALVLRDVEKNLLARVVEYVGR